MNEFFQQIKHKILFLNNIYIISEESIGAPLSKLHTEVENIIHLIEESNETELKQELNELHPADLAEVFKEINADERSRCFSLLDIETAGDLLDELEVSLQTELFSQLTLDQILEILELMPNDAVVDLLLGVLPKDQAKLIIKKLPDKESEQLMELMKYPENTAGGIMTTEYLKLISDMTIEQTVEYLRMRAGAENTSFYYLYVVNRNDKMVGVVGLRELITSPPYITIEEIMNPEVITVNVNDDQEEVAKLMQKYNFLLIPVVDDENKLKGIITWDDAQDVLEEEATEDYYTSSGIHIQENIDVDEILSGKLQTEIWARTPWLFLTMLAGFGAVGVGKFFDETIDAVPIMAIFLPLVIGLGGNTGIQSVTIIVRALYTGQINVHDAVKYILREFSAGLIIGLIFGVLVFVGSIFFIDEPVFALIVGLSLLLTICMGATIGAIVPFVLKRFNQDPAVASGPIITTGIDIMGIAIYFALITFMLKYYL
jgi:magnesium transporter